MSALSIVERAQKHFRNAENIMARSPRRVVRAPRHHGRAYKAILDELVARGFAPPRAQVRTPSARLLWIVLRTRRVMPEPFTSLAPA